MPISQDTFGFPESGRPVLKDVYGAVKIDKLDVKALNPLLATGFLRHTTGTGALTIDSNTYVTSGTLGSYMPYSGWNQDAFGGSYGIGFDGLSPTSYSAAIIASRPLLVLDGYTYVKGGLSAPANNYSINLGSDYNLILESGNIGYYGSYSNITIRAHAVNYDSQAGTIDVLIDDVPAYYAYGGAINITAGSASNGYGGSLNLSAGTGEMYGYYGGSGGSVNINAAGGYYGGNIYIQSGYSNNSGNYEGLYLNNSGGYTSISSGVIVASYQYSAYGLAFFNNSPIPKIDSTTASNVGIYTGGMGTPILDDTVFNGGYTIGMIIGALQQYGLLT